MHNINKHNNLFNLYLLLQSFNYFLKPNSILDLFCLQIYQTNTK